MVKQAYFEGILEFPHINKPNTIIVPSAVIPYTKINRTINYNEFVHFYEHDLKFSSVLTATSEHIETFKRFKGIISPDCSLYRDMPLCLQIANTYMNRAVGHYLQSQGIYVIQKDNGRITYKIVTVYPGKKE